MTVARGVKESCWSCGYTYHCHASMAVVTCPKCGTKVMRLDANGRRAQSVAFEDQPERTVS